MKKFLLGLFLTASVVAASQDYNNEWINYNQTYYKFKIGATGLYRISQPVLAGIGIGNTPAEHFQLWRNGKQIPLYTTVPSGILGSGDFIEFWGEKNDGEPDNILYRDPDYQLNDKISLQTDTAAFFLTINPAGGNLRFVNTSFTLPSSLLPEQYFVHTEGKYFAERINRGYAAVVGEYVYSSAYDQGEGFTTNDMYNATTRSETFANLYPYVGSGAPVPVLRVNASGNALNPRQFGVKVNGSLVATETMDFFDYKKAVIPLSAASVSSGSAVIEVTNLCTTANDRMVIAKEELTYPRTFNFCGAESFQFKLPANVSGNYLEIEGFNFGGVTAPVFYDITNGKRYVVDISGAPILKVVLTPSSSERKLLLVSQASSFPKQIISLQQRSFLNYAASGNQGNYLIISHPALMNGPNATNPVEEYRAYRSSTTGGGHVAKTYDINELVDQFGFGIKKNPLAIRNFIRWARITYSSPVKNVFLIGKGVNYMQHRAYEGHADIDKLMFVPTFGEPASDNLLAAEPGLNEIPQVSIGRLSAINPAEVAIYLAKVKQYEQQQAFQSPMISDKAWMKNVIHVVGASEPVLEGY
ncbi:MAG: hypothetical protein IPH18_16265 [Chitinophagaceae bacterium]|nr:hypothetical protein [Chitinophagaceae bacterium]